MDKVSTILPSKARITSVDTENTSAARPGAPTFGRKEGTSSVRDRAVISAKAKEMAAQETLLGRNPKELSRAKAVEEINRKFFETRLQKPVEVEELSLSEQVSDEVSQAEQIAPLKEQLIAGYDPATPAEPRLSIEG